MVSVYSSTNHIYFDYTPLWNDGPDPLPIKVANAALSIFINLATLFANACIGLGDLLDNLFTSFSPPTQNFHSGSYDAGHKLWGSPVSPTYFPEPSAPPYSKLYPTPTSSSVPSPSPNGPTAPSYFPEPSAPPYSKLYPTPTSSSVPSPSPNGPTSPSYFPEASAPPYSQLYPIPTSSSVPSNSTQSTFSPNLPEASPHQYSKFYPTPSAPPWDPSWGPYPG